jgi:hypothetical protein
VQLMNGNLHLNAKSKNLDSQVHAIGSDVFLPKQFRLNSATKLNLPRLLTSIVDEHATIKKQLAPSCLSATMGSRCADLERRENAPREAL